MSTIDPAHNQERNTPRDLTTPEAIAAACDSFDPVNFGFALRQDVPNPEDQRARTKEMPGIGQVCFSLLSWEHANSTVPWREADGATSRISFLEVVMRIQLLVWGMDARDALPPVDMAIIQDTGGYLGVAYDKDQGFTHEGWLGFVLGFGGVSGVLSSHMLAVRLDVRSSGMGQHLKVLQAHEALKSGHHAMEWTFDPMRSSNAHFNINKLGAIADRYVVNKYGDFRSELYGAVPSDRFFVRWQLTSPSVHRHLRRVWQGRSMNLSLDEIAHFPEATADNVARLVAEQATEIKLEVPGDIDTLAKSDPERALEWRQRVRHVGTCLLDTRQPRQIEGSALDPAMLTVAHSQGNYQVTGFVSHVENQSRRSFCIFTRKE